MMPSELKEVRYWWKAWRQFRSCRKVLQDNLKQLGQDSKIDRGSRTYIYYISLD